MSQLHFILSFFYLCRISIIQTLNLENDSKHLKDNKANTSQFDAIERLRKALSEGDKEATKEIMTKNPALITLDLILIALGEGVDFFDVVVGKTVEIEGEEEVATLLFRLLARIQLVGNINKTQAEVLLKAKTFKYLKPADLENCFLAMLACRQTGSISDRIFGQILDRFRKGKPIRCTGESATFAEVSYFPNYYNNRTKNKALHNYLLKISPDYQSYTRSKVD